MPDLKPIACALPDGRIAVYIGSDYKYLPVNKAVELITQLQTAITDIQQATPAAHEHPAPFADQLEKFQRQAMAAQSAVDRELAETQAAEELGDPIVGHKTFRDGAGFRHEPLRASEANAMLTACEQRAAARAKLMPDEAAAIDMFFEAYTRLKELGWNDACYCPKDGSHFLIIEAGSTGQHRCYYEGEWPSGSWWVIGDGDLYPSRPVLFKRLAEVPRG